MWSGYARTQSVDLVWGVGLGVQPVAGAVNARVKAAHLGEAKVQGELKTLASFTLYFLQIH